MSCAMPLEKESRSSVPGIIQGYVSVRSQGGKSAFKLTRLPKSATAYRCKKADRTQGAAALDSIGFTVTAESRLGFALAGTKEAYEELTGGTLVTTERLMHAEMGRQRYVTNIDIVGATQPKSCGVGRMKSTTTHLEGVLLERPRILAGIFPSPIPPTVDRDYLRVPDDVALGLSCAGAHRAGHRGDGVVVAMVDSGQFDHPFFDAHGYRVPPPVTVIPGTDPGGDPVGHGTGESANIFAAAPECTLRAYRASNNAGALVGAISGFLQAKSDNPAILTNSWGGDGPFPPNGPPDNFEITWALEILDAIDQGIFVVFSAGNGTFTIEPQVPGVMAAGGVYLENDFERRASNYASGYASPWFNLTVPDVCGLVGLRPRAQYIMLPVPPACEIDQSESVPIPGDQGDGTTSGDGWALFSGTSAAAPQVAGVAALVLAAKPGLSPARVTQALKSTAIDVRVGHCHPRFNNPAQLGHDSATGHGLVDATAAVQFALDNF